uniref:Uncharacterized protein n=1 Tax=Megaselia scalaris TaxID=36166 RepID=T1GC65_MEGSC
MNVLASHLQHPILELYLIMNSLGNHKGVAKHIIWSANLYVFADILSTKIKQQLIVSLLLSPPKRTPNLWSLSLGPTTITQE